MLNTYVYSLPDGTEQGEFLAIDLGGFHFRVLYVKLCGGKMQQVIEKRVIDNQTKQSTQECLFDFIAKCVAEFIEEKKLTKKLPLGFTFSFPVHQTSLTSGTLIRWNKDFSASGAEGQDVVKLLKQAFERRGDKDMEIVSLVNDTTGTQLTLRYTDPDCHVGLIFGTGTNACYTEQLDAVPKLKRDRSKYSQVIINCEWGAFGDDGKLDPWLTDYDRELDKQDKVLNKGEQLYEKMISGKYLGEIARQALQSLVKSGQLFGGKSSEKFDTFEAFETKYVSTVEGGDVSKCKQFLKDEFSIDASDSDCENVRRVCEAVSTRAARLAGAGVVALVKKINKLDKCSVAVDGSLYKEHPNFKNEMRKAMDELAPGNGIVMKPSEEGSGGGAAIIAATVASKPLGLLNK